MGRAPCCEKMGLKKGPWTPEEDKILISHIEKHGHGNWRALPKQAGLLRCGKSCRLRWTNYLRPDIKRGNFTKEEEEAIIQLHEEMGNRWSAIAAKLPGRTDNEIKNVWHTHLKKKLNKDQPAAAAPTRRTLKRKNSAASSTNKSNSDTASQTKPVDSTASSFSGTSSSSQQATSSSEVSFDSNATNDNLTEEANTIEYLDDLAEPLPEIDESFWSEALSSESSDMQSEYQENAFAGNEQQYLQTQASFSGMEEHQMYGYSSSMDEDREFWFNVLIGSEGLTDLPEF